MLRRSAFMIYTRTHYSLLHCEIRNATNILSVSSTHKYLQQNRPITDEAKQLIGRSIPRLFPESKGLDWNTLERSFKIFYELCENKNVESKSALPTSDMDDHSKELFTLFSQNPTFQKHFSEIQEILKNQAKKLSVGFSVVDGNKMDDNLNEVIDYLSCVVQIDCANIITMFHAHPNLLDLKCHELIEKIEIFRQYGVGGQLLQNIIIKSPRLLMMSKERLYRSEFFVVNNLQFTRQEIPKLLSKSPNIFLDPYDLTEKKLHFILTEMPGPKTYKQMSEHGILNFGIKFLKLRHAFLKRRGLYQQPDKNGYTQFANPPLKEIYCYNDSKFCNDIALCNVSELLCFKKLFDLEFELLENEIAEAEEDELEEEINQPKNIFADNLLSHL